jgi:hypothetical protein
MIRRLIAFILAFACAVALALPAHETDESGNPDACCCGDGPSTCGQRDCAPAPGAPLARVAPTVSTAEASAPEARPASRAARVFSVTFAALFQLDLVSSVPASAARQWQRAAVCTSAPLFQAHCCLLI